MKKRLLIISVSGIGNTILQGPLIRALLRQDLYSIDILFGSAQMAAVFKNDHSFNQKYILPPQKIERMKLIIKLKRNRYDSSLACFPSNRLEFHLLPFLIGAKQRIIHSYKKCRWRTLSCLSNCKHPANCELHDIQQNLELLKFFGIDPQSASHKLSISISAEDRAWADKIKKSFDDRPVMGIHPNLSAIKEKKWPMERFIQLAQALKKHFCVTALGTEEEVKPFKKLPGIISCSGTLNQIAAMISYCDALVTADTSLMHIGSIFKIRQYVLWGPTLYSRIKPFNENAVIIGRTDSRLYKYPFRGTRPGIRFKTAENNMLKIQVQDVLQVIDQDSAAGKFQTSMIIQK